MDFWARKMLKFLKVYSLSNNVNCFKFVNFDTIRGAGAPGPPGRRDSL